MKPKLVIFDLDGTLLDTIDDLKEAVNHAMSLRGFPTFTRDEVMAMVGHGARNLMRKALPLDHKDDDMVDAAYDDFRLLGDATRLRIFWTLCHEELSVAAVAERMGMTSPAVSHHLRALRDTGLVSARRDGREMRYRVSAGERCDLLHHVVEQVLRVECPEA